MATKKTKGPKKGKQKSKQKGGTAVSPKTSRKRVKFEATHQSLGVDVSKEKLNICFKEMDKDRKTRIRGQKKVDNTPKGWAAVLAYVNKFREGGLPFIVVMEATGVYHENLAYYLKDHDVPRSVVLPNMSKNYAKSLNQKSKNDKIDAYVLAKMGLERDLRIWEGMNPIMLTIKRLLREKEALHQQLTVVRNRLESVLSAFSSEKETIKRLKKQIKFLQKQIEAVDAQVMETYHSDKELKARVDKVCTIKGVAEQTALTVITETNGFELIQNKAQLVSYAGYDVVERQSGTSFKGKTKISKKGNAHIRRALHLPAFCAVTHEPKLAKLYERVLERNPKLKMLAYVAVQRKLLVLIYTLYKNDIEYDPNYENIKEEESSPEGAEKINDGMPEPAMA